MKLTKKQEEQTRETYANWLLSDCSCPVEEIQYLFEMLPDDHKKEIYLDLKENDLIKEKI
jgi:hypothetical protein